MLMQSTIADLINQHGDALTRAERQLAAAMLDNYPVSGLGTIADLAAKAGVSAPTVVRLVSKIGFKGFAEFQAAFVKRLKRAFPTRSPSMTAGPKPRPRRTSSTSSPMPSSATSGNRWPVSTIHRSMMPAA
jgi:DNA-binding MurR/RpiR family transcriptional regulator